MSTTNSIPRRVRIAFPRPPKNTGIVAVVLLTLAVVYVLLRG